MEFGLGKFLEMFEERFGKKATTYLLALIGLGISSWMVKLIFTNAIWPLSKLIKQLPEIVNSSWHTLWINFAAIAVSVGLTMTLVSLAISVLFWVGIYYDRKVLTEVRQLFDQAKQLANKAETVIEEHERRNHLKPHPD